MKQLKKQLKAQPSVRKASLVKYYDAKKKKNVTLSVGAISQVRPKILGKHQSVTKLYWLITIKDLECYIVKEWED